MNVGSNTIKKHISLSFKRSKASLLYFSISVCSAAKHQTIRIAPICLITQHLDKYPHKNNVYNL